LEKIKPGKYSYQILSSEFGSRKGILWKVIPRTNMIPHRRNFKCDQDFPKGIHTQDELLFDCIGF